MRYFVAVLIALIILMVLGFVVFASKPFDSNKDLTKFAQCLADKGVTMYGADWCPHCQREKKAFGEAFKYVPYVECPDNPQLCIEKGVNGYPTWILADGQKLEGEQGIDKLKNVSGCEIF